MIICSHVCLPPVSPISVSRLAPRQTVWCALVRWCQMAMECVTIPWMSTSTSPSRPSNSCEETNAAKFAQAVEDALLDMRALLEDTATAEQWSHTGAWHGVRVPPGLDGMTGTEPMPESLAEGHSDIDAQSTERAGTEGKPVIKGFWVQNVWVSVHCLCDGI